MIKEIGEGDFVALFLAINIPVLVKNDSSFHPSFESKFLF